MLKIYLKQAWMLVKQNRLFSVIYVLGTSIAIALVMVIFIVFYIKLAPIYPEYNRREMMAVKMVKRFPKGNPDSWSMNMGTSYRLIRDFLPNIPHVVKATGCLPVWGDDVKVGRVGDNEETKVISMYADASFWNVFSFRFLEGKPFTVADVEAGRPVAVLSRDMAETLFAKTDVVGERFTLSGREMIVCGVVKSASNATPNSAADVYLPLWLSPFLENEQTATGLFGNICAYFVVDDSNYKDEVKLAVQRVQEQVNREDPDYDYDLGGQPEDIFLSSYRRFDVTAEWWRDIIKPIIFMLTALLFIPAFNLSGMISSRMDDRLSEMGVRKAYGATNGQLLRQILLENLLLTAAGCVVGLLLSYLIVYTASDWILTLFDHHVMSSDSTVSISPEMLFNPVLFLIVSFVCLLLNVVSAVVPVSHALRHTIIYSLNSKR